MIYVNGSPVNTTMFPDGTSQVWKVPQLELPDTNFIHIRWDFATEGEFMQLAQLKMLADRMGFRSFLDITFLPYGRQDKPIANDATFALAAFAKLLNALEFTEVGIVDPHSDVALKIINNSKAIYPTKPLREALLSTMTTLACYPDKGAVSKYVSIYEAEVGEEFVWGEKVRDQLTGHITSYQLMGILPIKGRSVMIVDDICDGGMTFKILAKDLLDAGAKEVNLFVTHGIFSRGLKTLHESGIKRIFTKDGEAGEVQNQITYRRL